MQNFPEFVHIFVALDTICGFKWVKNSGKIDTKYVSAKLNISDKWVTDSCVSIQINLWGFLQVTQQVLHACKTRMHSSRMHTSHSLTICWCLLPGRCLLKGGVSGPREGVSALGQCLVPGGGVSALGGLVQGECLLQGGLVMGGGIPACTEADPPSPHVQNS